MAEVIGYIVLFLIVIGLLVVLFDVVKSNFLNGTIKCELKDLIKEELEQIKNYNENLKDNIFNLYEMVYKLKHKEVKKIEKLTNTFSHMNGIYVSFVSKDKSYVNSKFGWGLKFKVQLKDIDNKLKELEEIVKNSKKSK